MSLLMAVSQLRCGSRNTGHARSVERCPPRAELCAQFTLEQFATGILGQGVDKEHLLGCLKSSEVRAAVCDQVFLGEDDPIADYHCGDHGLHPDRVRDAENRNFLDAAVAVEHLLDLPAGDVLTP